VKRDITVKEIIEELKQLPPEAKITVDTKLEMRVVGFVLAKKDNARQISEIITPKAK